MVSSAKIVLCGRESDAPGMFARVVERLVNCGASIGKADIVERQSFKKSVTEKEHPINLQPTPDWEALAADIIQSEKKLVVYLPYELNHRGSVIGLDAQFYGKRFRHGIPVKDEWHIRVDFSFADLCDWAVLRQSTQKKMVEYHRWLSSYPSQERTEHLHEFAYQEDMIFRDAEDLFFDVCGRRNADHDGDVAHAFMYQEYGICPPYICSMVFHRDKREVCRDVARNFAEVEWGTPMLPTLVPNVNIMELKDKFPECREDSGRLRFATMSSYMDRDTRDIYDFLLGCTVEDVLRVQNLSVDALDALLDYLESVHSHVVPHRFTDGAVSLNSHPRIGLSEAYQIFVETTRPGGVNSWLV